MEIHRPHHEEGLNNELVGGIVLRPYVPHGAKRIGEGDQFRPFTRKFFKLRYPINTKISDFCRISAFEFGPEQNDRF